MASGEDITKIMEAITESDELLPHCVNETDRQIVMLGGAVARLTMVVHELQEEVRKLKRDIHGEHA